MCRMIGCFAFSKTDLSYPLLDAPYALVRQSKQDRSGKTHRDGWGIACWNGDFAPLVHKNFKPAFEDKFFAEHASQLQAPVWIAHVRAASSGNVRLENTHPFQHRRWAWAHNGTIIKPLDLLSEVIVDNIAPEFRELRRGATDTELCFLLFLTELSRRSNGKLDNPPLETAATAMRAVINFLHTIVSPLKQNPPTMNFMASNGKILLATRWGKSLWTLQTTRTSDEDGNTGSSVIYIASEPFDDNDWRELPDPSLVAVDEYGILKVARLEN
jgi:glutamine amidotransferase